MCVNMNVHPMNEHPNVTNALAMQNLQPCQKCYLISKKLLVTFPSAAPDKPITVLRD